MYTTVAQPAAALLRIEEPQNVELPSEIPNSEQAEVSCSISPCSPVAWKGRTACLLGLQGTKRPFWEPSLRGLLPPAFSSCTLWGLLYS